MENKRKDSTLPVLSLGTRT